MKNVINRSIFTFLSSRLHIGASLVLVPFMFQKMANKIDKKHFEDEDTQNKLYFKELISEIFKLEKKGVVDKQKISALKSKICRKYSIMQPPRDMDILMTADLEDLKRLKHLKSKPTRSLSGVAVVAIMTKPEKCPHGKCIFCPGGVESNFGDTPQSYTGFEPATRRAIRNNYDSFFQVFNRLEQYVLSGHDPTKVDLIIMGGTFPSYSLEYRQIFLIGAYLAMNTFSELFYEKGELDYAKFKEWFELPHSVNNKEMEIKLKNKFQEIRDERLRELPEDLAKTLDIVKEKNEISAIRCIGLTQETRPDFAFEEHAKEMLAQGTTRVEVGVQCVYNDVLEKVERGHTVEDSIKATKILKNMGFKVNYHMMIGLPGMEDDLENLREIFRNPDFRPDMLKIYPCLLLPGTKLYENKNFKPIGLEDAAEVIGKFLAEVPEYVRVMRIQRDIPSTLVEGGVNKTNLRQYVDKYMEKHDLKSKEIRAREISRVKDIDEDSIAIKIKEYEASKGKEFFISAEDKYGVLIGFCRLRLGEMNIIRELHVYGAAIGVGKKSEQSSGQHKGWGKKLLETAEQIAKSNKVEKLYVISGVGVREYYRKQSYVNDGYYVSKIL